MQGRWYITAGLNPLFDTFDCQAHFFGVPEPGKLLGKINWRISKGDEDFIERSTTQKFVQARFPVLLWLLAALVHTCLIFGSSIRHSEVVYHNTQVLYAA